MNLPPIHTSPSGHPKPRPTLPLSEAHRLHQLALEYDRYHADEDTAAMRQDSQAALERLWLHSTTGIRP